MTDFKCPNCGSPYFGRDTALINGRVERQYTVRCHGQAEGGKRCDYRGVWIDDYMRDNMTAKPNLWVVLSEAYGFIVHVTSVKEEAEKFCKHSCYKTSIVEYAPVETLRVDTPQVVWSEDALRKFKCPRCECAWFRTPDIRENIVECSGCKYKCPRSECGLGKAVEKEEGKA